MDVILLKKDYIIEGVSLKKEAKILYEDNKYNNMLLNDKDESINESDFMDMIQPMLNKIEEEGLFEDNDKIQIIKDSIDYMKRHWARYRKLPPWEELFAYLLDRNPNFAK